MLSTTYLYRIGGRVAAYATVCMTSVVLGTREKPASIPYKQIAALQLLRLGVDRRFQGAGLGRDVVGDIIGLGWEVLEHIGCRYPALDAHPDLVGWYERQGFTINKAMQNKRIETFASRHGGATLPVSMRFDLLNF